MIASFIRYWHTLRHLKLSQFVYRLWYKIYCPRPDQRPAPELQVPVMKWVPSQRLVSMTGPETFTLLNVEHRITSAADWNNIQWSKLWLYNLHYFDDLNADDASFRKIWHTELLTRWIADNPPGQGNGWEPYPCSLRIVNWVQWAWAGNQLSTDAVQSVAVQSRWLSSNLEFHLLGNHLWANAKALCFAGCFFCGVEAVSWLKKGSALISRELQEQVLPDGGHFERSPMYHSIILVDVLDLIQLTRCFPACFDGKLVQDLHHAAHRMRYWLKVMCHPDGDISFFNDSTLGIAPKPAAIEAYALSLALPPIVLPLNGIIHLPESGFLRLQNERAVVLADVGAVAPNYIPGHAHAGTLSFELSVDGHRALMNSGISSYENDAERLRQRGTAAHNTVKVAGVDSSEVWSAFRVARRVRIVLVETSGNDEIWAEAKHDGYRALGIWHRRRWRLSEHGLSVNDYLDGQAVDAIAYWHWAPSAQHISLRTDGQRTTENANWHPGFNRSEPIRCEIISFREALVTEFSWNT